MARTPIKDSRGNLKGTIEDSWDGGKKVFDFRGNLLGTYDKRTNQTKDYRGTVRSVGDTLASFLH